MSISNCIWYINYVATLSVFIVVKLGVIIKTYHDSGGDNVGRIKYHLPAEHNGGGNNETQRNHTDIKQRRIFIERHKENRCHFIQSV